MKAYPIPFILILLTLLALLPAHAQTNSVTPPNAPPTYPTIGGALVGIGQGIKDGLASGLTNVDGVAYGEWTGKNVGGGVGVFFRTSPYLAYGFALDYLDGWSAVNANISLQAPTEPFQNVPWLPAWLRTTKVTPNLFSGLGTPIGGSGSYNWTLMTVIGGGGSVVFHSWKYLDLGAGYDRLYRNGTGNHDGGYNTVFLQTHIYVPGFSGSNPSAPAATTAKDNSDYWDRL